ncbi:TetR/AcrR family transcriptional regulator [Pedobacter ureilyticus]|jgi:AcrR family transcriptional regulator|uniref:TetR/AcrR family transcriptional regulator n=1 Tax=Pedobacter ureilyticus TaxID=1393051 RepID=A0ABW9J4H6_9SPHI|nr:TetR/AcrR family transcriptional regulator [Pedobacter helvus]
MGSKERIQRQKEDTRKGILAAALQIVKQDGWPALSMRKIADVIEYTAPIIYEYFPNKEGILFELTRQGYVNLGLKVKAARDSKTDPEERLEAMWLAYWDFAFEESEFYQLMYGVQVNCCEMYKKMPEAEYTTDLFYDAIEVLLTKKPISDDVSDLKYYTFWSLIHGLISLNLVQKGANDQINQEILRSAIKAIIKTIND